MSLRVVFAGTPEFALPCLQALLRGPASPLAVYTQPDRPAGRGRHLQPSPVKQAALAAGIEVRQPASLRDPDAQAALRALAPDLLVVVAYGLILPQAVLDIPRLGCWNIHASLLPRWRGAAPIQRAIEAGDRQTGVCLMQMEKGLDTGPVLLRQSIDIADDETAGSLHDRLAALGARVLADGIGLLRAGLRPQPVAQPDDGVSYARKLEKHEARLDWQQPAEQLARRVRAFSPWPVAEAELAGERLRIHRACALELDHAAPPGTVLRAGRDGLDVACASGALRLLEVQRAGGRPLPIADFLNARPELRAEGPGA
jgi:methionyl-tRNA formyltransferase